MARQIVNPPFLSLVIPLYNEEKRVQKAINALNDYLRNQSFIHETIFVDDGSVDKTINKIGSLNPRFPFRIVSYTPNKGKGYALKQGFLAAKGDYILFLDVDMSTPIKELDKFKPWINEGYDVIIGTRKAKGAQLLRKQPLIRQRLGEVFTLLSNLLVGGVSDFTCGFKCFSHAAGKKIFSAETINRWGFDTEILFLARKYGYVITELPVIWSDDPHSRVNLVKDVYRSLNDLILITINNIRGVYDK